MRILLKIFFALAATGLLAACSHRDDPEPPEPQSFETVVLVYAAANNNLYNNLLSDKAEMLAGLKETDPQKVRLLLLENNPEQSAEKPRGNILYEARYDSKLKGFNFVKVKDFPTEQFVTDPEMLSAVESYVRANRKADKYGLIFWSHGGGWAPGFGDHLYPHAAPSQSVAPPKPDSWWGVDEVGGLADKMNIDELAAALPSHAYEFIWFDSCYMSSIELAWELRDKAKYLVAYPTEVYTPGLDYEAALPYIMRSEPDLAGAAKSLYDYYTYNFTTSAMAVTVGVFDLEVMPEIAAIARKAFAGYQRPATETMQKYTRSPASPAYDFRQYLELAAAKSGVQLDSNEIDAAFKKFTIVKYASLYDFSYRPISQENYSGISAHIYDPTSTGAVENFYRSLGWYKEVFSGQ